ncbi:hypothetical protein VT84_23925 [Gemmata sp. SH-PL17]|uniref:hypothetical protein n=1 Tax=Gemmata sp. SH-PL17 TaxID=1630693 RepID=UPI00078B65AA|nr:hypothetical protein [Gemmata sp. SH-PL17]AMV27470.1 hypothetical protein VT84_23925 [Gemmata sp. SH-PL17]
MLLKLLLPALALALVVGACEWLRATSTHRPLSLRELDAHLRSEFKLRELRLAPLADARFEGHGTGANNRTYEFEIVQSDRHRMIRVAESTNARFASDPVSYTTRTDFTDRTHIYLLLGFGYLTAIGKVVRDSSGTRSEGAQPGPLVRSTTTTRAGSAR